MQNLNLYNYYDKSLADINKDFLEIKAAARQKAAPKKSGGKAIAAFMILTVVIGCGIGYYLYKQQIDRALVKTRYAKPDGPDLRSTEEKLGYVKVQIFEFADEPAKNETVKEDKTDTSSALASKIREFSMSNSSKQERPTAYDEKKKLMESVDKINPKREVTLQTPSRKEAEKPVENTAKNQMASVDRTPPLKPAEPIVKEKLYSIVFEDINKEHYDFLKKAGSIFKVKGETVDSKPSMKTVWKVYRMNDNGNIEIGGKRTDFIKEFDDKEEAVKFAKDNKIQSIIRSENVDNGLYSVRFCCSTLENSKKFAENSNITNKTIRIIREE